MSKRAMSIDNLSFSVRDSIDELRFNKENNNTSNGQFDSQNSSREQLDITHEEINRNGMTPTRQDNENNAEEQIIPWRAHLRKTNSRLSLIG